MRFEPGALTARDGIPLCVPQIGGNEWKYLKECLDTNWVSSGGPFVDRFEGIVADYIGAQYSVATVNGTAALHIAILVAGVQPDDEVLVSTLSFIAPANAVRYVGAWPVFVDADPSYWQMDAERVVDFLEKECRWTNSELRNKQTGRRVRAIIPVHILGYPCDMDPILKIARKFNLVVIEDATESLGASYKGRKVGSLGDIACFSFNGNKVITTGGGGMIVTNNAEWAHRARYLTTQAKDDSLEYIHKEIGYNYRLTNIQAALGCAQMENLDECIAAKRRIARAYAEAFATIPGITCMPVAPWASSIFWLYTVLLEQKVYGINSRVLMRQFEAYGIQARPLWQPLHLSPAHPQGQPHSCPAAERLANNAISLPSSVGLRAEEQGRVIEIVKASAAHR